MLNRWNFLKTGFYEGINLVEVIASDLAGGVRSQALTVISSMGENGLFGRVTDITTSSSGLVVIILDTTEGVQRLEVTPNTIVRIPGDERANAADISPGDFLAVVARVGEARLEALNILVKPEAPAIHGHFTGSVVRAEGDQATIMDKAGNVITTDLISEVAALSRAQVVTAVVRQETGTGRLSMLGAETAEAKIERLSNALRNAIDAGARENTEVLGGRLVAGTAGHLTTLQEYLHRVEPGLTFVLAQALQAYETLLGSFRLGGPTLELSGVIEDIDPTGSSVVVSPQEGPEVRVRLTGATAVSLFGQDASPEALELGQHIGQRVRSIYDPKSQQAQTLDVIFPAVADNLVASLLLQAGQRELEGALDTVDAAADPPVVVIRLPRGATVRLTVTPETRIRVRDEPRGLEDLAPITGVQLKVRYDPSTLEALDIETFDPGGTFISGVVKSVIPKFGRNIPGLGVDGNITVTSLEGEDITLKVTENTIIERDGLMVPVALVRFGDLVRPTSRYDPRTREVQRLAVKRPGLEGTVRGKISAPSGRDYLTVSTAGLNLVTLQLAPSAEVTKNGGEADFAALEAGDRIVSALFNPFNLVASELGVELPRALRTMGTISELDRSKGVVTVRTAGGDLIKLLVPAKPGIVSLDGSPKSIRDLETGDKVQAVFYRPDKVVIRIFVTSQ